jgi:hypothetical protein
MADGPVAQCLTCNTPMTLEESAVFRNGAKITHLRCWTPKDLVAPIRHADQAAQPPLASGRGASGGAAR